MERSPAIKDVLKFHLSTHCRVFVQFSVAATLYSNTSKLLYMISMCKAIVCRQWLQSIATHCRNTLPPCVSDGERPHQSGKSTPAASRCQLSDTVSSVSLACCVRVLVHVRACAQVAETEVPSRSFAAVLRSTVVMLLCSEVGPSSPESEGRLTTVHTHSRGVDQANACLYHGGSRSPRGQKNMQSSTHQAWELDL